MVINEFEALKKFLEIKIEELKQSINFLDFSESEQTKSYEFVRSADRVKNITVFAGDSPSKKYSLNRPILYLIYEGKNKVCVKSRRGIEMYDKSLLQSREGVLITCKVTRNMYELYFCEDKTTSKIIRTLVNETLNKEIYGEEYQDYLIKKEKQNKY